MIESHPQTKILKTTVVFIASLRYRSFDGSCDLAAKASHHGKNKVLCLNLSTAVKMKCK